MHYHVGYNMPGYLPDQDPWVTNSESAAKESMIETLDRHGEDAYLRREGPARDDQGRFDVDLFVAARKSLRPQVSIDGGWERYIDGLAYWIYPCTEMGPDHEEAE